MPDELLVKTFLYGIVFPLLAWVLVSPFILAWWWIEREFLGGDWRPVSKKSLPVWVGFFLWLLFVLTQGIEGMLFFIPADWGVYDDGEFVSNRTGLAWFIAFPLTIFIFAFLSQVGQLHGEIHELQEENNRLSIELSVREKEERFQRLGLQDSRELHTEETARLRKLTDRSESGELTRDEKREIEILKRVLCSLENQITGLEIEDEERR